VSPVASGALGSVRLLVSEAGGEPWPSGAQGAWALHVFGRDMDEDYLEGLVLGAIGGAIAIGCALIGGHLATAVGILIVKLGVPTPALRRWRLVSS
jgi:hypothetical protein